MIVTIVTSGYMWSPRPAQRGLQAKNARFFVYFRSSRKYSEGFIEGQIGVGVERDCE